MKRRLLPLFAPLLLSPPAAFAQERYFALGTGTSQTAASAVRLRVPARQSDVRFDGVTWRISPFEPAPYYVIKYGQWFADRPRWGIEFDFTHNKAIARTEQRVAASGTWNGAPIDDVAPLNQRVQEIRFTNGVNIFSALALHRFAPPESRLQPLVGLGPSYYLLYSRNRVDNRRHEARFHGVGVGWIALAGVRYRLGRRVSAFAEAKYTDGPGRVPTADEGRLSTTLRSWHETAGILWHF